MFVRKWRLDILPVLMAHQSTSHPWQHQRMIARDFQA